VGSDSSAGGFGRRRGFGRAASIFVALLSVLLLAGGCGDSGHGAETDPEKGSDAAILNRALARELALLDVYTRGNRVLSKRQRALGRRLRAQQQEYVDAVTKAIRGLGGDTEAEAEEVDFTGVKDARALLALATELEDAAVEFYVDEATHLYTAAPRTLDAWLAAGHGEHLGMLPPGGG
jgi:Ferritin-like domain